MSLIGIFSTKYFQQDEDPDSSWQYLQENDLVALLNQIPMADVFRHVLQIEVVNGKVWSLFENRTTGNITEHGSNSGTNAEILEILLMKLVSKQEKSSLSRTGDSVGQQSGPIEFWCRGRHHCSQPLPDRPLINQKAPLFC